MIPVQKVGSVEEFIAKGLQARSETVVSDTRAQVEPIIARVRAEGDAALFDFTERFDKADLRQRGLRVSEREIEAAVEAVGDGFKAALTAAISRLQKFHRAQRPTDLEVDMGQGVRIGRIWKPVEAVGLYVPGGRAPYVTVAYMLAVPAFVAGCSRVVLCTPPNADGQINPYVLASAHAAGIREIYKLGGAQAIAAMAYGTESIAPVAKLFGPGNVYVTAAKNLVSQHVGVDMPAGPSEAAIISDGSVSGEYIAADLLSQAEHDPNSAAILLTTSEAHARAVAEAVSVQLESAPRKAIIAEALSRNGHIVICPDLDICVRISNCYGPEHLQLMTRRDHELLAQVTNAGSVCVGAFSPVAFGDYICGTNNVLPTGGATRMYSAITTEAFMVSVQIQFGTKEGLAELFPAVKTLAQCEGFDAHLESIAIRLR